MDECEDHSAKFAGLPHTDAKHDPKGEAGWLPEHKRGAGHPQHHTKGKMPAQLNPDHGPHHSTSRRG